MFTKLHSSSPLSKPILSRPISSHSHHHSIHSLIATADDLFTAHRLFDEIPQPNSASFNSLIAARCRLGQADSAWPLLSRMLSLNLRPTSFTFGPILSSPSLSLSRGAQLHPLLLKLGLLHSDAYSSTSLMGLFCRHQELHDAFKLFDGMSNKTVVTWNILISTFSHLGFARDCVFLFRELLRTADVIPSECSFLSILSSFRSPDSWCLLEQVHGLVVRTGVACYAVVSNSLLHAYSNCFALNVSERLFNDLSVRDLVSWNTKISAFANSEMSERALDVFCEMRFEGLSPNDNTLVSVLGACIGFSSPVWGEFIHAKAIKYGFGSSVFVGSSLVDFYAKCKSMEDARRVFDVMPFKNLVSWNALISGYSNKGSSALVAFVKEILFSGFRPNEFTFSSVLRNVTALDLRQLHSLIIRMGYSHHDYVLSALMTSYDVHNMMYDALACGISPISPFQVAPSNVIAGIYNRGGRYENTKELLFHLQDPDAISWNILITACARNGDFSEAFQLFKSMQTVGYLLDNYTAVSLLSICSKTNGLELGSSLHGLMIKTCVETSDVFVRNLLMDMYAKCGNIESCSRVFEEMGERNLISWTTLISGLGLHGCAHGALRRFRQMESDGLEPDGVAFLALLSACRHGGFVEEGMLLFIRMKSVYRIEPKMDHYIVLVDLLCRFGHVDEAEQVISGMPFQPNAVIWRIFLQGCKRYP